MEGLNSIQSFEQHTFEFSSSSFCDGSGSGLPCPILLYFDSAMPLSSPTLTKADDGAVHGVSTLWLDHAESGGKQLNVVPKKWAETHKNKWLLEKNVEVRKSCSWTLELSRFLREKWCNQQ